MKIAAVDPGSNSFHMVVVEATTSGGFRAIGREQEMVRPGSGSLARHRAELVQEVFGVPVRIDIAAAGAPRPRARRA